MNTRHARRRLSNPARSATIRRSATHSTVSLDERATTQRSTSVATWYRWAASSRAIVSLSLVSSELSVPVYMKFIILLTALGSRSVMVTSFSACSFIEVDHIASNTGDRAARMTLCARMLSSPTLTTTSVKRPDTRSAPNWDPKSTSASGLLPTTYGTDSTLEKDTVILHSTVSVSSTSHPFVGSSTLRSGMKPSACSLPSA
mmetsp:Transcript_60292/g.166877  ORF Transcript_60292/g.166877 Transcript_60292/m.166877 type:complete len:202 (-) Transcript_60292:489-1094(-)